MINVYKSPVKISRPQLDRLYENNRRKIDFRITRVKPGEENLFFDRGSPLRSHLTADLKPVPPADKVITEKQILALEKAEGFSVVADAESFEEALAGLAEIAKRPAEDEFLAARKTADSKTFIMKGTRHNEPESEMVTSINVPVPFVPYGPTAHIHPPISVNTPTLPDVELAAFYGNNFGLIIGYKILSGEEMKLSKYYTIGPFRTIDFLPCMKENVTDAVFHAFSNDGRRMLRNYYYSLNSSPGWMGVTDGERHEIIEQYRNDMNRAGSEIKKLEEELYPDPGADFRKAIRLAGLYIETQHALNALMLLRKLPGGESNDEINEMGNLAYQRMPDLTIRII